MQKREMDREIPIYSDIIEEYLHEIMCPDLLPETNSS